jgi:MFS family permease
MAFGLGFIIGPGIGALLAPFGHEGMGLFAVGLSLVNLVSAYFILPESLRAEHRVARDWWPFGHMADALAHPELRPLMLVWLIAPFAFAGYTVALPLWAAATLGWQERGGELNRFFIVVGIVAAVVQGGLFRLLTKRFSDRRLLITGMVGMAVSIGVVPFLASTRALYGWTVLLAFSNSIMSPAATGLVSIFAGATEQGTVLGVAQSLSALGRFSGPAVIGIAYDSTTPKAVFLGAAGVMLVGWVASLGVPRANRSGQPTGQAAPAG